MFCHVKLFLKKLIIKLIDLKKDNKTEDKIRQTLFFLNFVNYKSIHKLIDTVWLRIEFEI